MSKSAKASSAIQKKVREEYWLKKLSNDFAHYFHLQKSSHTGINTYHKNSCAEFELEAFNTISNTIARSPVALFTLMVGALQTVLHRHTAHDNPALSSCSLKLKPEDTNEHLIILGADFQKNISFRELLSNTKSEVLHTYQNQENNCTEILEKLSIEQPGIGFIYQTIQQEIEAFHRCSILFQLTESGSMQIRYDAEYIDHRLVQQIGIHLNRLLSEIAINLDLQLSEIPILSPEEVQRLTSCENTLEQDPSVTLVDFFERQVLLHPDKTGLEYGSVEKSYQRINSNANQIARQLLKFKISPSDKVGIYMSRSTELVEAILAVFKAGMVYVPLDLSLPEERINYILKDSECGILVTDQPVSGYSGRIIDVQEDSIRQAPDTNPEISIGHSDPAYIIYTSGSTGMPKGVVVNHGNLAHFMATLPEVTGINANDVVPFLASHAFDISVFELFGALAYGGKTLILDREQLLDRTVLLENLKKCTLFHIVPALMSQITDEIILGGLKTQFTNVRQVFAGGDVVSETLLSNMQHAFTNANVGILYGPTEATIFCTAYHHTPEKPVTSTLIGSPTPNVQLLILDRHRQLCPVGTFGEIYIGGPGVSSGYHNREELNSEMFVRNPFGPGKIYKSGDLARWNQNFELEFLGRTDNQVKIRGYRIELGEIETTIKHLSFVKEAVVLTHFLEASHENVLVAYVVSESSREKIKTKLKKALSQQLPGHMIPSFIVELDQFPLTSNGKTDRKNLPDPIAFTENIKEFIPASTPTEYTLVDLWKDLLRIDRIGVLDDFFELGGHSLKATMLASKIKSSFGKTISVKQIFLHPNIKDLAFLLDQTIESPDQERGIPIAAPQELYPLSSAQKRMYVLYSMDPDSTVYNMPLFLHIQGPLNLDQFEAAIHRIVERHESLRTTFVWKDNLPYQKIHASIPFEITRFQSNDRMETEAILREFNKPFDLHSGPCFRIGLVQTGSDSFVLMVDTHHIVSDGMSLEILIKEFIALYKQELLPPLEIQYKDYAVWQNHQLNQGVIERQKQYWNQTLSGTLPDLSLPFDYKRPTVQNFDGAFYPFSIPVELVDRLHRICTESHSTMFALLLAGYQVLLSRYSGQQDVIVGIPASGRSHSGLIDVMGMFVNTLAIRAYPEGNKTFTQFLEEVKTQSLDALENQDFQFEDIINELNIQRDPGRNPIFTTMFSIQNVSSLEESIGELQFSGFEQDNSIAKFDLSLSVSETDSEILCNLNFATSLFHPKTITRMVDHFLYLLDQITSDPNRTLAEFALSNQTHESTILTDRIYHTIPVSDAGTIVSLIEEQVLQHPDRPAIEYKDNTVTYQELNKNANRLAHYLLSNGLQPGDRVGMYLSRSIKMVEAIVALNKAGLVYVPIDLSYPSERVTFIIEDSDAKAILTDQNTPILDENGTNRLLFDLRTVDWESWSAENPNVPLLQKDMAYIIYTSGSTGKPKGVEVSHGNLFGFLENIKYINDLSESDTMPFMASNAFDIAFFEIFNTLICGGKTIILDKDQLLNQSELLRILKKSTVFHTVPAMMRKIVDHIKDSKSTADFEHVREVYVGGDLVPVYLLPAMQEVFENAQIKVLYGPTEGTIFCTTYNYRKGTELHSHKIGSPTPNTKIFVVDEHLHICPTGVLGEICIGGPGVTQGYLNRPELNQEKYIRNPFGNGFLYKTGDMARWNSNDELEFSGRSDNQVKIRGFRIETGEIENTLNRHASIKESIVTPYKPDHSDEIYLVAYLVKKDLDAPVNLETELAKSLPEYMIPSYFIELESFPLTPNGKIDKKQLPEPTKQMFNTSGFVKPVTDTEIQLVRIWKKVLGFDASSEIQIGTSDDFFRIGGHSLKAIDVVQQIKKEFSVEIPLKSLFTHSTVQKLALLVDQSSISIFEAIVPVEKQAFYPVSSAQKRMFLVNQMFGEATSYNMPALFRLEGKLDYDRLNSAFNQLIQRHESLRTSFRLEDGVPIQIVHSEDVYINTVPKSISEKEVQEYIKGFVKPFDLGEAPLFRIELLQIMDHTHYLLIDLHHIVTDGFSMGIIMTEFLTLYSGETLPELQIQYKDYANWQNQPSTHLKIAGQRSYWQNQFSDEIPVLELPLDFKRPTQQTFKGNSTGYTLDPATSKKIHQIARTHEVTPNVLLLAAINILLSKYSNQNDIVIGTATAGRNHPGLNDIVGMFVNTLALRNRPSGNQSFDEFLKEVKNNFLEALENQDYPFEELLDILNLERDLSRNPLFDVMFTVQTLESRTQPDLSTLNVLSVENPEQSSKFDLSISATIGEERIHLNFGYRADLFLPSTMERMANHFGAIIEAIIEDSTVKLGAIQLLSEKERTLILKEFNETSHRFEDSTTLPELFTRQAGRTPDQIALVHHDRKMTYSELNDRSNQLAHWLIEKGIQTEDLVAMVTTRSMEMVVGMLAILKAGGAYMPIDPDTPKERLDYLLEDSKANILLHNFSEDPRFDQILHFDLNTIDQLNGSTTNPNLTLSPENLAYVIYTSGSTGNPKGVLLEHKGVVNRIEWMKCQYNFLPEDIVLQKTTYTFDVSVWEFFMTLCYGAKLVLCDKALVADPTGLVNLIEKEKITTVHFVPSMFNVFLSALQESDRTKLRSLKNIFASGEALSPESVQKHYENMDAQLHNLYGPTEASIDVSYYKTSTEDTIVPIGRPIWNTQLLILDENLNLLPVGITGELHIAGTGLARGYLNRPDLTREKFMAHGPIHGERLYKTGDIARWLPDGNIVYMGRTDHQVKIRGFRIETGEIEQTLLSLENVQECAVIALKDKANLQFLCAYLVEKVPSKSSVYRDELSKFLPDYMIPDYFVTLNRLPLSSSGKLNRKELPPPTIVKDTKKQVEHPVTDTEKNVDQVWKTILELTSIDVTDNFFAIGGHSLRGASVVARLNKDFNTAIKLRDLFEAPTIRQLAKKIDESETITDHLIEALPVREYYEVSPAQKRLWLLDRIQGKSTEYNMVFMEPIADSIEIPLFEQAIHLLIERHETLRTTFIELEGLPKQVVHASSVIPVIHVDFTDKEDPKSELSRLYQQEFNFSFDLQQGPLVRITLVKETHNHYHLIFGLHHIITDGWSMEILRKEVMVLYSALKRGVKPDLPELQIQYKEFAHWQNQQLLGPALEAHRNFWHETLSGDLPTILLPSDHHEFSGMNNTGSTYHFYADQSTLTGINQLAQQSNSSIFMVLLSVFNIMLSKICDAEDIIVGTPSAGRDHEDIKGLNGFFLNTLVLRNKVDTQYRFSELLESVKNNVLGALDHQIYPFEQLVDELNIPRDLNKFPITSIFFNMLNFGDGKAGRITDFNPQHSEDNHRVKFDINLYAREYENGIRFNCVYKNELFKKETIEAIFEKFIKLLNAVISDPEIAIRQLSTGIAVPRSIGTMGIKEPSWYSTKISLVERFQQVVTKHPGRTAVKFGDTILSYAQLDQVTNQLASTILNAVKKPSTIALCTEHNHYMVIGVWAILKAGCTYVPLDPDYPVDRLKYILDETKPVLILGDNSTQFLVDGFTINSVLDSVILDDVHAAFHHSPTVVEPLEIKPENPAYILYTSGSTGNPKGVIQTHGAVLHFISNYSACLSLTEEDRLTGFSSISFDSFVNDMYGALLNGAAYYPLSLKKGISLSQLNAWLEKEGISVWHSVPTVFRQFATELISSNGRTDALRIIKMTGEPTSKDDFNKYKRIANPECCFVVSYGSTESTLTSINVLNHTSSVGQAIVPAGKVVHNTEIRLIHPAYAHVDLLEAGEILIHSPFITPGYFHNDTINSSSFVMEDGKRYYKSGDLGRIGIDGQLEIIGRKDNQIKIRGVRVETGEIEQALIGLNPINQAVAKVHPDESGIAQLSVYFTTHSNIHVPIGPLRNDLQKILPDYFIPTYFVQLETLPLTPNGKIDKRNLPVPGEEHLGRSVDFVAPSTTIEKQIADIWREILKVELIGAGDNFFELGGHSLRATAFVARYHKRYGINIPLQQVFKTSTVRGLAGYVEFTEVTGYVQIQPATPQESYPLSFAQKRLYILSQFEKEATNYNMPSILHVRGLLEKERFENAFKTLVHRHESLRTNFKRNGDEVVQCIRSADAFVVQHRKATEAEVEKIIPSFVRPFDLENDFLFRVELIEITPDHHILMLDMHHIISDGRSGQIIQQDFIDLYNGPALPPLPLQYKDYAVWQTNIAASGGLKQQETFWLETLSDDLPTLELPYDYPRPAVQSFAGGRISFDLTSEQTAKLKDYASQQESTLYMVLLAVYKIFLHKYSGNKDIAVGSPISGRPDVDLENIIGMFVNTLVLRSQPQGEKPFKTYLQEIKDKSIAAFDHQLFSFEEIIGQLNLARDLSRNPVFDTMFVLQDRFETESVMDANLRFETYKTSMNSSKFDLSLMAYQSSDSIQFVLEYCSDLFSPATVEKFGRVITSIIDQISQGPDLDIKDIQVISKEERDTILLRTQNQKDYGVKHTISQKVALHAANTPEKPALVFKNKHISYVDVYEKANAFAVPLMKISNSRIGIIMDKSPETVYAILGAFIAGNSYVPILPDTPLQRIEFILRDAEIRVVFTDKKLNLSSDVLQILPSEIEESGLLMDDRSSLDSEAYVIYTSGTTGKPKGVGISQRALVEKLEAELDICSRGINISTIFTSSFTFDASIVELFPSLYLGGKITIPESDKLMDFEYLYQLIKKERVCAIQGTTSYFKTFLQNTSEIDKTDCSLEQLCLGGESLTSDLVKQMRKEFPKAQINNLYGPTEITVDAIGKPNVKTFEKNIIGKPFPNSKVYILSEQEQLVPDGVVGEICIGGVSVSKGYINRPELTKKVFVDNPFADNEKIYKTGDLGRWTAEGEIEFLGRKDDQFKIRGYRVELGEIESRLMLHDSVHQAFINVKRNASGDNELIAYFVSDAKLTSNELRSFIGQSLPSYMIPSYFVQLDEIPLTSSGKVNKRALPVPEESELDTGVEYVAGKGDLQNQLISIWKVVLQKEKIGIKENFFDLGGHSLKATQVVSRIQKEMSYELNLREFFSNPTVELLSAFLEKKDYGSFKGIEPVAEAEDYELSNPQRRLWIIDQLGGNRTVYNMPGAHTLHGIVNYEAFKATFREIVDRHEILRTSFINVDGHPRQKITPSEEFAFDVEITDLSDKPGKEERAYEIAQKTALTEFDLAKGPLLVAKLLKLEPNKHIFLFTIHHIISDGWSMEVLINEVTALYKAKVSGLPSPLKPLKLQYKDFAIWQNHRITVSDETYWLQKLAGDIGLIQLPTDFPKDEFNEGIGEQERLLIDEGIVLKLKELAKEHQTTLSNVVFAVFNILLSQLSGQTDLLVGMTSANRNHPDIEDLIGFFVNSLVIRTDLSGDVSFGDLLEQVKKTTSEAFEHQNYPFDLLVEKLSPERFTNHQPLVNVTYSFQNLKDLALATEDAANIRLTDEQHALQFQHYNFGEGNNTSKFDILLFVNEINGSMDLNFEYNSALFKRETIRKFLGYFKRFLQMVTEPPDGV